jgi:hypothetical protein
MEPMKSMTGGEKWWLDALGQPSTRSSVYCRFDPIKEGRAVTKVKMTWFPKDEAGLMLAYKALERHRSGRKARISGKIEPIALVRDERLIAADSEPVYFGA